MNRKAKIHALRRLGALRRGARCPRYRCLGDFHHGAFECDFVSPWSKAGNNVHAEVMIVGQDWASADMLKRKPPNPHMMKHGYNPGLATNIRLDHLLLRWFGLKRRDCYLTNLFPFIKRGGASAAIRMADLVESARTYTREEIRIVAPQLVICLGLKTFRALMRVGRIRGSPRMEQAIASPFTLEGAMIHCVAHTGAFGTNNRSSAKVAKDWQKLARRYPQVCR